VAAWHTPHIEVLAQDQKDASRLEHGDVDREHRDERRAGRYAAAEIASRSGVYASPWACATAS
jgi:hypothetical protein